MRKVERRKSRNVERIKFGRGLDNLLRQKINIKEVVTDGNLKIGALMSKHSWLFCFFVNVIKFVLYVSIFKLAILYVVSMDICSWQSIWQGICFGHLSFDFWQLSCGLLLHTRVILQLATAFLTNSFYLYGYVFYVTLLFSTTCKMMLK